LVRKFMSSCPVDLHDVIVLAKSERIIRRDITPELDENEFLNLPVFCHRSIVEELVEELFQNAVVHKKSSLKGNVRVKISVRHDTQNDNVELLFLYLGTDPDYRDPNEAGPGRQGLEKLEKALEPYNAQIEWGRHAENQWDYFTRIRFLFGGKT